MNHYTNIEILSSVIAYWLRPMGDSVAKMVIGDKLNGISDWAKRMFPLSPNYSVMDDISFLVKPTIDSMITPAVRSMIEKSGIDDASIPCWARKMIAAMEEEISHKGEIVLFEKMTFTQDDIQQLKCLIENNVPKSSTMEYDVIG